MILFTILKELTKETSCLGATCPASDILEKAI